MTFGIAVLVASLLGSVHCAAMCGAFTCLYSDASGTGQASYRAHAAYNLGRLLSYLFLGTLAGAMGASLSRAGLLAGVENGAAIVAGVLLVVWGMHALLVARGIRLGILRPPASWQHAMGGALLHFRGQRPVVRAAATGLLTTLLPCGWLYAFVVTAAGTGSPVAGGALMAFFWLGTLPMMVAVGIGLQRATGRFREQLPTVSALVIVVLGALSLAAHLGILPIAESLHRLTSVVPVAHAPDPAGILPH